MASMTTTPTVHEGRGDAPCGMRGRRLRGWWIDVRLAPSGHDKRPQMGEPTCFRKLGRSPRPWTASCNCWPLWCMQMLWLFVVHVSSIFFVLCHFVVRHCRTISSRQSYKSASTLYPTYTVKHAEHIQNRVCLDIWHVLSSYYNTNIGHDTYNNH